MWFSLDGLLAPFTKRAQTWALLTTAFLVLLILGLAVPRGSLAQSPDSSSEQQVEAAPRGSELARSAVAFQAGGGSGMLGLQYEYRGGDSWAVRAGIGGGAIPIPTSLFGGEGVLLLGFVGVPLGASWLPGGGALRPELGVSVAPGLFGGVPVAWRGPSAGVRYHPTDGGLYVRATGHRLVAVAEDFAEGTWHVGISVGYSF